MTENMMNTTPAAPQPRPNSQTTLILGVVLIIAIVGLVALQFMQNRPTPQPAPLEVQPINENESGMLFPVDETQMPAGTLQGIEETADSTVKVFEIEAGSYYYQPSEIRVNLGDTVRIVLHSTDMMHNLVIDDYGINSPIVPAGESTTIEFVADQAGAFEYYCTVMNHRQMGQVGMLIVEE